MCKQVLTYHFDQKPVFLGVFIMILFFFTIGCTDDNSESKEGSSTAPSIWDSVLPCPDTTNMKLENVDGCPVNWSGAGDPPIFHARTCEYDDARIWMIICEFPEEADAQVYFSQQSIYLHDLFSLTTVNVPWLQNADESMQWVSDTYPNWEYENGQSAEGVFFRIGRFVVDFEFEDCNPLLISPSQSHEASIGPRGIVYSAFIDVCNNTTLELQKLK